MDAEQKEQFESYLSKLEELQHRYVASTIDGRREDATWPRRAFRLTGAAVVLLSITIPYLSSLTEEDYAWKNPVISIVALLVAALTSLNSFFRWGEAWRENETAASTLIGLSAVWELKIAEARQQPDFETAERLATDATHHLLQRTAKLMDSKTHALLKGIELPQMSGK